MHPSGVGATGTDEDDTKEPRRRCAVFLRQ